MEFTEQRSRLSWLVGDRARGISSALAFIIAVALTTLFAVAVHRGASLWFIALCVARTCEILLVSYIPISVLYLWWGRDLDNVTNAVLAFLVVNAVSQVVVYVWCLEPKGAGPIPHAVFSPPTVGAILALMIISLLLNVHLVAGYPRRHKILDRAKGNCTENGRHQCTSVVPQWPLPVHVDHTKRDPIDERTMTCDMQRGSLPRAACPTERKTNSYGQIEEQGGPWTNVPLSE